VSGAVAHVRWVGELPDRERGPDGNHALIAEELRSRPGEWAMLPDLAPSFSAQIRSGVNTAYRPAGTYEATARNGVLYARYVGGAR